MTYLIIGHVRRCVIFNVMNLRGPIWCPRRGVYTYVTKVAGALVRVLKQCTFGRLVLIVLDCICHYHSRISVGIMCTISVQYYIRNEQYIYYEQ